MKFGDRIKESSTTSGTGTLTLSGAQFGFTTFSSVFSVGDVVPYAIYSYLGGWEVGIGTLLSSTSLSRDLVYSSSNNNTFVSFGGESKDVFCSTPAFFVSRLQTKGQVASRYFDMF
jgi:hypothetical protein